MRRGPLSVGMSHFSCGSCGRWFNVWSPAATAVFCSEAKVSVVRFEELIQALLCSLSFELQRSQSGHISCFLSCEVFYVEVCMEENGHIRSVRLVQGTHQEVRPAHNVTLTCSEAATTSTRSPAHLLTCYASITIPHLIVTSRLLQRCTVRLPG